MFRNRIYENRRLKYRTKKLESFIRSNLFQRDEVIVSNLVKLWNDQGAIDLQPFQFGGNYYQLCVEFYQLVNQFECKVAKTPKEIRKLIENGSQYICEQEGLKFFRKRK